MNRRRVVSGIGTSALFALAGCSGVLLDTGPPHLRVVNYDDAVHTLSVTVRREGENAPVFDTEYEIPADGNQTEDQIFDQSGTFETTADLDGETTKTFRWTIDDMPVGGGFRLVVEKGGSVHDDVVGSP